MDHTMDAIKVSGVIVQKVSQKGKPYYVCEVPLTKDYTASFFPQKAEVELLKLYLKTIQENK